MPFDKFFDYFNYMQEEKVYWFSRINVFINKNKRKK